MLAPSGTLAKPDVAHHGRGDAKRADCPPRAALHRTWCGGYRGTGSTLTVEQPRTPAASPACCYLTRRPRGLGDRGAWGGQRGCTSATAGTDQLDGPRLLGLIRQPNGQAAAGQEPDAGRADTPGPGARSTWKKRKERISCRVPDDIASFCEGCIREILRRVREDGATSWVFSFQSSVFSVQWLELGVWQAGVVCAVTGCYLRRRRGGRGSAGWPLHRRWLGPVDNGLAGD